jgi:2-C-methyl-D-erythritol 2,4-cyclodiphosphate synthase
VLAQHNARAVNVDATLIAEAPKIAPHIHQMRGNIARALQLDGSRISIKATTNEGLGTIGRGEGMAAMAVASVEQG